MPPGWDGIETIKNIWKIDRDIQVVICTAYSDYTWEETVKELGIGDNLLIIKKPFDNAAVRQLATALTKKWFLMQQTREYTNKLEKQVEERTNLLQESVSEIRATLESSADGILVVTNNGKIADYNNKFVKMWEIPEDALKSKEFSSVLKDIQSKLGEPNKLTADIEDLTSKLAQIRTQEVTLTSGQIFEYYTQPYELDGRIVGRVWSFRDVTQRIYLEKKLQHQATHDTLTNLPNRLLLIDRIKHSMENSNRNNTIFALLFFDLDRFKVINDVLGHAIGDQLLIEVAGRVKSLVRESDTVARIGGDEFVLILTEVRDKKYLVDIINRVLIDISKPFNISERELHITASIGVCVYPKDGTTPEELLRNADLAMYIAKRDGRNKFQFYEKSLNQESLIKLEKESALRRAIDNQEFVLYYQPQIDASSHRMVGVEALLRWQHPSQGLISPVEFLEVAEDSGLIIELGKWVFKTACQQAAMWHKAGAAFLRIAINVSNRQINDPNFSKMLDEVIEETKVDPKLMQIEITEDVVINNDRVINVINQMSNRGIRVAFDDFGTGNSSLNYLRMVPINQLKIDRSFIKNINHNKNDEVIIRAILSMANDLELDVIAEGVETDDQLQFLSKHKCHEIQGFYFSKPLAAEEITALIMNDKPT